eukprot:s2058_g13.t1
MTADAFLAAVSACAKGRGDAKQVAEALSVLESGSLWPELREIGWEKLRLAEAQLRSFALDELAKARRGHPVPALTELPEDLLRPPWIQVPSRVEAAFRKQLDELEVLCTADCHPEMDEAELCWHCWHKDECNGPPTEIQELLELSLRLSKSASISHRARIAEERWPYIQRLTQEVEALAPRKLLVLGGLGVSAVRAAKAGGEVLLLLPGNDGNETMQEVLQQVMRDNGVSEQVRVVTSLTSLEDLESFDACALEGLEPDGIFGSGVVEIWQKLQPRMRAKVLPQRLQMSVALAKARLTEAPGVKVDLGLLRQRWVHLGIRRAAEEALLSSARLVKAFRNLDSGLSREAVSRASSAGTASARLRSRSPRRDARPPLHRAPAPPPRPPSVPRSSRHAEHRDRGRREDRSSRREHREEREVREERREERAPREERREDRPAREERREEPSEHSFEEESEEEEPRGDDPPRDPAEDRVEVKRESPAGDNTPGSRRPAEPEGVPPHKKDEEASRGHGHRPKKKKKKKAKNRGGTKHQRHWREVNDPLRRSHRPLASSRTALATSFQSGIDRRA